jgi:uncharacterized phage protein (TIGR02220 family)
VNYYPHHIGDYARDTGHLSMLEDAAYRRMLDVAYATEKPLPRDQSAIYRLVRARTHAEKLAVDIVLGEFWVEREDGWHNARADAEIAKAHEKSTKARGSAKKRWDSDGNANASAMAMRTHSEGNAPNNQEPIASSQKPNEINGIVGLTPDERPPAVKNGYDHDKTRKLRSQAVELLAFLNEKARRNYQPVPANVDLIVARLRDGASVEDCRAVIAKKCREWLGDAEMNEYLRPATLFNRTKFAQYQGELAPAGQA